MRACWGTWAGELADALAGICVCAQHSRLLHQRSDATPAPWHGSARADWGRCTASLPWCCGRTQGHLRQLRAAVRQPGSQAAHPAGPSSAGQGRGPEGAGCMLARHALCLWCRTPQPQRGGQEHEAIRTVVLDSHPFSIENGLLTPTMKKKRPAIARHYAQRAGCHAAKPIKKVLISYPAPFWLNATPTCGCAVAPGSALLNRSLQLMAGWLLVVGLRCCRGHPSVAQGQASWGGHRPPAPSKGQESSDLRHVGVVAVAHRWGICTR